MFVSYSASKRRNQPPYPQYEFGMPSSRNQQYNRRFEPTSSYQDKSKFSATKRQTSSKKQKQNQHNKENYNRIQMRQEPYESKFACSPLKQPYVPYDLSKSRRNASQRPRKQAQVEQIQPCSPYMQPVQPKQNYRPRNYGNNKKQPLTNLQPQKITNQLDFSYRNSKYDNYSAKAPIYERQAPQTYRGPSRTNQLSVTFSNQFSSQNNLPNSSKTPPKTGIQTEKLVQKSQFLRQRIQRINRMTPRGSRIIQSMSQSVTPQKQQSVELPPKESYENVIIKYNKYCDQKLPLQTIYDAQQHKFQSNWREVDYEAQANLLKINKLSQKISSRLSAIISKHSK